MPDHGSHTGAHAHAGHFADCTHKHGCTCETRRYCYVLYISLGIIAIELVGWWLSNSLALLGDSGHVAGDAVAISIALLISVRVRSQPLKEAMRTRILGFALQIVLLAFVGTWILIEGVVRYFTPPEIIPLPLLIAAILGGSANLWQVGILEGGFRNFNVLGTRVHLWADFITSAGVVVGAVIITTTGWYLVDPILSLMIALFIFGQVYRLFMLANRERRRKRTQGGDKPH